MQTVSDGHLELADSIAVIASTQELQVPHIHVVAEELHVTIGKQSVGSTRMGGNQRVVGAVVVMYSRQIVVLRPGLIADGGEVEFAIHRAVPTRCPAVSRCPHQPPMRIRSANIVTGTRCISRKVRGFPQNHRVRCSIRVLMHADRFT